MSARLDRVLKDQAISRALHHKLISKSKTVTTAGTAEPLVSVPTKVQSASLMTKVGNTGQVYAGDYQVSSSDNDGLDAGVSLNLNPDEDGFIDLSLVYIDVDTSGEGVDIYYTTIPDRLLVLPPLSVPPLAPPE